jgi:hypothetical protein
MANLILIVIFNYFIALEALSAELFEDIIGIEQAATWGVVLKAAADHTASAKQKVMKILS